MMFALASAMEPTRIGIATLLVALPRPFRNLLAFCLGLWTSGACYAVAGLFLVRDAVAPLLLTVRAATASPVVPPIKIAFGVLAIASVATLVVRAKLRQAAPVQVPVGGPSVSSGLELRPKKPALFSSLSPASWSTRVEGGSVAMAFIAGLATSTAPVEFLGAMTAILASGAGAAIQLSAALTFLLVGFTIAEIPLASYLLAPVKTRGAVTQLRGWLRAHQRPIFLVFLSVFGVFMVAGGVGGI